MDRQYHLLAAPFLTLLLLAPSPLAQSTERVSVGPGGLEGNDRCESVDLSGDGRVVVFSSLASNLVAGDANGTWDIFAHDRETGATELVSRTPQATAGSSASRQPTVSADGRWVLFESAAQDLTPSGGSGVHVYDRATQTMVLMRHPTSGLGLQVDHARLSPDGRYVVFDTVAVLAPEDTNALKDVYRWDRINDTYTLVSTDGAGIQNDQSVVDPAISLGGRYVAFQGGTTTWATVPAFTSMVWRKDMVTGTLELASSLMDGTPASHLSSAPRISDDGGTVAFQTVAQNIPGYPGQSQHIAIKDFSTGECSVVSLNSAGQAAGNYCWEPRIGGDGRFVSFRTVGQNMPGPSNLYSTFVRDRAANTTHYVSVSTGLQEGNGNSYAGAVSICGGYVAFYSEANNLVPGDTAGHADIFVRDLFGIGPHGYGRVTAQSTGCLPTLSWSGAPASMSVPTGFLLELSGVRTAQPGLLIYSRTGPAVVPFLGERLYLAAPIVRTPVQQAGGSTSGPCNGAFSFDFNAHLASGVDGALGAGSVVHAQYWSRDPGGSSHAWLSDAVRFEVVP